VANTARRRVAAVAALVAAAYASPAAAMLPGGRAPGVLTRVGASGRAVALTFDDGPHPEGTPAVLEALAGHDLRATFFVVGERASRHPRLLGEILAAGHDVALHGHRHIPHAVTPPRIVLRDLERGRAEVERAAGVPVAAVRAPFGAASLATVVFARRHALTLAGWSRWGWDWMPGATARSIARSLVDPVEAGDILLLHDSDAYSAPGSWRRTAAALPLVAASLRARDLTAVPLRDLVSR
jgi:peptidoglycan/xylan/chitin deacetylase (PgdA/CDA1 family)